MSYYIDVETRKFRNKVLRMAYLVGNPGSRAIDEVRRITNLDLYGFMDWLESASPEALDKFANYPFTDD